MRDVRPQYSIGLPVLSISLCVAVAIISPSFYRSHVRRHEVGVLEQGTVISLIPAVVLGAIVLRRRNELPRRWLGAWVLLLALGALYFAGEECSWGQNYFGWGTPDGWSQINDQNETNLHNTSSMFDHLPRAVLTLAAAFSIVSPIALARRQRYRNPRATPLAWLLPTPAVVPSAALALLVGLPQKLYGKYDKTGEVQSWFSEMFLAGRHSELKEYFLALFILMYLWSFATRLGSMKSTATGLGEWESWRAAA